MLSNNKYNKNKVLHDLSCLCWFVDKHAIDEAKKSNDQDLAKNLEKLKQDLNKHIEAFDSTISGVCKK
jgi:hypothetical protein